MSEQPDEWEAFVGGVRDGQLDLSALAEDALTAATSGQQ